MCVECAGTLSESQLDDLVGRLSLAAKVRLLSGETAWTTPAEQSIGLRSLVLSDGPVGVRGLSWDERDWGITCPSPTALAASWDPGLVEQIGSLLGSDARRKNVDVLLAPTVNLHRTPFGGRHFECLSEDPQLTAQIGAAYVRGVQAEGVGATLKHYVANDSETERMTYQAVIDQQALHEVYLRPFEDIVAAACPWLVMAAYNAVNGPTMTENPLLQEPLETRWQFDGVVISDWNAVRSTAASAAAATDLAMPGPVTPWSGDKLVAAVDGGEVDEVAIDAKVRRLLRLAGRVGAIDTPTCPRPAVSQPTVSRRGSALVRKAAAAGAVLVRNDGVLPLDRSRLRRVAMIGAGVEHVRIQGGGSAWVAPEYTVSPLAGMAAALGTGMVVVTAPGVLVDPRLRPFAAGDVTDPVDGSPGLRVRLRSADGVTWRDERRDTGKLLWMQHPDVERIADVEASCVFTAPESGAYEVGFAALGEVVARSDGEIFFEGRLAAPSDNHLRTLQAPPEVLREVMLQRGDQLRLEVRLRPGGLSRDIALLILGARLRRLSDDDEIAHAAALAADCDVAVVMVGTTEQVESEGFDRESLALPGRQDELVRAVLAANPRTVVVVNSGAPVELPWLDGAAAVLLTWFPGQEAGNALADVLTGEVEPGGRMPTTWPVRAADCPVLSAVPESGNLAYTEGIHVGYRGWLRTGVAPALPFGFGLGYTSWQFTDLALRRPERRDRAVELIASVTVTNTGERAGWQTVQVYLCRDQTTVDRPKRWLAGFARVQAAAGDTVTVAIPLHRRAFAHWSSVEDDWAYETGAFDVLVGDSVVATPLRSEWMLAVD